MVSASELSGFTCTSSLKQWTRKFNTARGRRVGIENFEFIVSEWEQVSPDNSRAVTALTFLLFKLNTLQKYSSKFESAEAMV